MWTDLAQWLRRLRGGLLATGLVLVAAVIGACVGYGTASSYYATQGAVVVLPPGAGSEDAGQNPFANLFNSTQFTAVVGTNVRSEATRDAVAAKSGARRDYVVETVFREVRANFAQNVAQIEYTINGPDRESAQRGADALVAAIRETVRTLQADAGVPEERWAKVQVAVPAPAAHEVTGDLVIAALRDAGIAVAVAVVVMLAGLFTASVRAGRRSGSGDTRAIAHA